MFINIYVWYVGLKEIYMSSTYTLKKKTNFSAKIKYSFSTYRTSYFYLKSFLIFLSWTKYNNKSTFVRTWTQRRCKDSDIFLR